jgi:hypothetical protein
VTGTLDARRAWTQLSFGRGGELVTAPGASLDSSVGGALSTLEADGRLERGVVAASSCGET